MKERNLTNTKMFKTIFIAKNNLTKLNVTREIGIIWANHKCSDKSIKNRSTTWWENGQERSFTEEEKQMALKHIKRCSIKCIIREMRYHFPHQINKNHSLTIHYVRIDVRKWALSYIVHVSINWCGSTWERFWHHSLNLKCHTCYPRNSAFWNFF